MPPVDVSISAISVAYGDTLPLRGLSLDVYKGEFLSLLGPSGCGKTTTLRSVAGFIHPHEGDIRIGGASVLGVPPNRRNLGMVYQDYALFPHMTVRDNVAFGLRMRGVGAAEAGQRAAAMITKLQLGAMVDRLPTQLSGGQQQRVALARAMVINPAVLLLDEPLAALDKQLRADMQFELRALQREVGITAIFVTHDQEEALSLSDRIAVMNKGQILQVDTPRQVYDFPSHRFVAEFIGTANFLSARVVDPGATLATVEIAGLSGRHALSGRLAGGDVTLMIRPEALRLTPAAADVDSGGDAAFDISAGTGVTGADASLAAGPNRVRGRIASAVFQGAGLKYQVAVGDNHLLRVDQPVRGDREPSPGDAVWVHWDAAAVRVYRNDLLEL